MESSGGFSLFTNVNAGGGGIVTLGQTWMNLSEYEICIRGSLELSNKHPQYMTYDLG